MPQKSTFHRRFAEIIREYRTKSGLSQEKLGDMAGLHRTYISLLERGERNPSLDVVESLAKALGTSMAELVSAAEQRGRR